MAGVRPPSARLGGVPVGPRRRRDMCRSASTSALVELRRLHRAFEWSRLTSLSPGRNVRRFAAECALCPKRALRRVGREIGIDLCGLVVAVAHPALERP